MKIFGFQQILIGLDHWRWRWRNCTQPNAIAYSSHLQNTNSHLEFLLDKTHYLYFDDVANLLTSGAVSYCLCAFFECVGCLA